MESFKDMIPQVYIGTRQVYLYAVTPNSKLHVACLFSLLFSLFLCEIVYKCSNRPTEWRKQVSHFRMIIKSY